jgi:HEPN domain-containing protein
MKEILKKWILFARADLDAAKRLFNIPRPTRWTYLLVLWHCHQTIEKMLKTVMIKKGKDLLKIHDLVRLYELAKITLAEQEIEFLEDLNEYYLRPRYPDMVYKPLPEPTKEFTQKYLKRTKKLFLWLKKQK